MRTLLKFFLGFLLCLLVIIGAVMNEIAIEKRKESERQQRATDDIMFDINQKKRLDLEPLLSAEEMDSIVDKSLRDLDSKLDQSKH